MSYRKHIALSQSSGFSLVQTLIVFVIVGLILGVVLSGARLYTQSRLFSNGIKAATIENAVNEFKSQYGALPGDFGDRETSSFLSFGEAVPALPGCDNDPAQSCRGGDLNGIIGLANKAIFAEQNATSNNDIDQENILFWYHLAAADLFKSVAFKTPTTSGGGFGKVLPASPWRGGYHIKTMGGFDSTKTGDAAAPDGLDGLYMVWQAAPFIRADQSFIVTPHQATVLDRKFDDGKPLSGKIMGRGRNSGPNTTDGCRLTAEKYDEVNDSTVSCYMIFRIGNYAGF